MLPFSRQSWSEYVFYTNVSHGNRILTGQTDVCVSFLFLRFYLSLFRERGREGEREGEKHQCVVASHVPPTGDLACNPGMRI